MVSNTNIIAGGERFDIGCRVVLWDEPNGLSFYKKSNLVKRDLSLKELQKYIKCFVVHHSVTYRAQHMYAGLNARGLSCNFMIDDDINDDGFATIYQCADIKDYCWTHKPLNSKGPGVEISYMPDAWSNPNRYSLNNLKKYKVESHSVLEDKIHGRNFKVFAPTEAQIKSCIALLWGFSEFFPDVLSTFPQDADGNVIKTIVPNPNGFLAHFHITARKIDPMGFPFKRVEEEVKKLKDDYSSIASLDDYPVIVTEPPEESLIEDIDQNDGYNDKIKEEPHIDLAPPDIKESCIQIVIRIIKRILRIGGLF